MFSDFTSVRSDPQGPYSPNIRINKSSYYFDNRDQYISASRIQNVNNCQRWKDLLLPQIDQRYNQIIKERQICGYESPMLGSYINQQSRSRVSATSKKSRIVQRISGSNIRDQRTVWQYQQKIRSLEQQNQNLKDELFYLRGALLLNFENKNTKDLSNQKKNRKKSDFSENSN